jgi:hypothetical protein
VYVFFVLGKQKESSDKVLVKGYDPCPIAFPVAIGDNQPHNSCAHVMVSERIMSAATTKGNKSDFS